MIAAERPKPIETGDKNRSKMVKMGEGFSRPSNLLRQTPPYLGKGKKSKTRCSLPFPLPQMQGVSLYEKASKFKRGAITIDVELHAGV